jgi:pimeloyl-ACP methyl ester carboxylesterase
MLETSTSAAREHPYYPYDSAALPSRFLVLRSVKLRLVGRPVLAVELPHISQRWVLWVPTVDEVTEVVVSILNRNAITSCCLVGHSYGTAVASRLLQQAPHRIQQLCLVDPICFTMFMPNLLRNFLYESPRSGNLLGDFMVSQPSVFA